MIEDSFKKFSDEECASRDFPTKNERSEEEEWSREDAIVVRSPHWPVMIENVKGCRSCKSEPIFFEEGWYEDRETYFGCYNFGEMKEDCKPNRIHIDDDGHAYCITHLIKEWNSQQVVSGE